MITRQQLAKWKAGLRTTFPIVGPMRQRSALTALERNRNDPAAIPLLAEAAAMPDAQTADRTRQAAG